MWFGPRPPTTLCGTCAGVGHWHQMVAAQAQGEDEGGQIMVCMPCGNCRGVGRHLGLVPPL